MALAVVLAPPPQDTYVGALTGFLNRVSPALLIRDRWGFDILLDVFGIGPDSGLYSKASWPLARRESIMARGKLMLDGAADRTGFLADLGFDFTAVPEPYKTELKAFFAWRLSRPVNRTYDWYVRSVYLIAFVTDWATSGRREWPSSLITFGHPIEQGEGNGSTRLRLLMERWLLAGNRSTVQQKQRYIAIGRRDLEMVERAYGGVNSMPANDLLRTLVLLRERGKPVGQRDFLLKEDVFPEDLLFPNGRREDALNFYKLRLPWLRAAARAYLLDRIDYRELGPTTTETHLAQFCYLECCLFKTHSVPELRHITQEFVSSTFLSWGNSKGLAGKNWYSDSINLLSWACLNLSADGWPSLTFDKRNLRKVHGEWPGGRGYDENMRKRTIPEEVVEQIFGGIESGSFPILLKRLFIISRYTGMRAGDLHELDWDCLKPDPDDDRFCLLTFFQRKVQKWNTKPLLVDDAAHAMVIEAVNAQKQEAVSQFGKRPKYLFGVRYGDAEIPLGTDHSREEIARWCVENRVVEKDGKVHRFRWHSLRHFYGTELALLGHDITLIQMELGHASPDMSMVYVNQRLRLKKKAVLEKGAGRYIDIKGQIDEKVAELAVRKDASLTVDVPGGLCSMPQQIGEWCEHNRACFECVFFRADVEQISFFESERKALTSTVRRLGAEADTFEADGRAKSAEIGRKRAQRSANALETVNTVLATIKAKGTYSGTERKYKRAGGVGDGAQCLGQEEG